LRFRVDIEAAQMYRADRLVGKVGLFSKEGWFPGSVI
jgi:hypothetical protein